jgi:dienelactone hydrolase
MRTKCNLTRSALDTSRRHSRENCSTTSITKIMEPKLITAAAIVLLVTAIDSSAQTPLPHAFTGITALPDQTISLTLTGRVASALRPYFDVYPLEVSRDLVTWQPMATLVRTNASTNALIYVDSEAVAFSARFYRTFTNQLVTPLARPSGRYAVGRIKRLMTDPSRTNRYNIPTNSSFMVTIWYPADAKAGVLPGEYVEKRLVQTIGGNIWAEPENVSKMFSFSLPDVPLTTNGSAFPVVIYATGYYSPRDTNSEKAEELASHGYVVAAMDHSESFGTLFPDGRVLSGAFAPEGYTETEAARILPGRVQDVKVVIDELGHMNSADPRFSGHLDLGKVGGLGWSAGVGTIAESARVDARIKAVVCLEGYLQGAVELRQLGLQKPLLAIYQQSTSNKTLFTKASSDAYWCQIRGSEHITFRDLVDLSMANTTSRAASAATRAGMLSFFDKYLKGEDNHLLDNPTNNFPVIFNYVKK